MGKERGWKIGKKPKLVIIEGTKNSQNEKEKKIRKYIPGMLKNDVG